MRDSAGGWLWGGGSSSSSRYGVIVHGTPGQQDDMLAWVYCRGAARTSRLWVFGRPRATSHDGTGQAASR